MKSLDVCALLAKCYESAGLGRAGRPNLAALRELEIRAMRNAKPVAKRGCEFHLNLARPGDVLTRGEVLTPLAVKTKDAERFGWSRNYSAKRKCVNIQTRNLRTHSRRQRIRLVELSLACNPENHLASCVSAELISYEISPHIHHKQKAGEPYQGFWCRKQTYLRGNVMAAVLEERHPKANFFNNDTMGTLAGLVGKRLRSYGAVLTAFLGDGTAPRYYRPVLLTGGTRTNARGFSSTRHTQEEQDRLMRKLCFEPIEPWYSYPSEFSALEIATRTYFYKPNRSVCAWRASSDFILCIAHRERWERTWQRRSRRTK